MADVGDVYLLGITCNIHESSAALVKNGVLIAAVEEERFTRRRHDSRFPEQAIVIYLRWKAMPRCSWPTFSARGFP